VELRPGILLGVAPRFHAPSGWTERLRLNGGVERAGARFHPCADWRPLVPDELAQLVDEAPADAHPLRARLLVIPAWLRAAWWNQVDRASYERFASELLGFLRFKAMPLPALCDVRVTVSRPGQRGTRLDAIGDLSGLGPAPSVPGAAEVAAINLGDEATDVVLLNLQPGAMAEMIGGRAGGAPPLPLSDLVPRFFEARPAYPLVRIRLDPGEGLWFPGDVVHDGWTCEKRDLDVVLTICGSTDS
jgi:hypothetical protein